MPLIIFNLIFTVFTTCIKHWLYLTTVWLKLQIHEYKYQISSKHLKKWKTALLILTPVYIISNCKVTKICNPLLMSLQTGMTFVLDFHVKILSDKTAALIHVMKANEDPECLSSRSALQSHLHESAEEIEKWRKTMTWWKVTLMWFSVCVKLISLHWLLWQMTLVQSHDIGQQAKIHQRQHIIFSQHTHHTHTHGPRGVNYMHALQNNIQANECNFRRCYDISIGSRCVSVALVFGEIKTATLRAQMHGLVQTQLHNSWNYPTFEEKAVCCVIQNVAV